MTTNPVNHPTGYNRESVQRRRKEAATEAALFALLGLAVLAGGIWWFLDEDPGIHQRTYDLIQDGAIFLLAMLAAFHALPKGRPR